MRIPTWNRIVAEFTEPFGAGQPLELCRHAERSLPDLYLAALREGGSLERYVASVAGFFRAAFGDSLWSALDPGATEERRARVAAGFDQALGRRIAADPEAAACEWHMAVLDIAM